MLSLIMPAKNESAFIEDAINALLPIDCLDWELIVINDHSDDDTFNIVKRISDTDERVKIYDNAGKGKVQALNYGYTLCQGTHVKFIDADDVLLPSYFTQLIKYQDHDAQCHSAYVTDQNLKKITTYHINKNIFSLEYKKIYENLLSIPRGMWSFKREIADKIFPMPDELPFEDIWFSLSINRSTNDICYMKEECYLYRQHGNQTFGGILNFSRDVVEFRAKRLMRLMDVIENKGTRLAPDEPSSFEQTRKVCDVQIKNPKLMTIMSYDELSLYLKFKLILICKLPNFAIMMMRLKWFFDK